MDGQTQRRWSKPELVVIARSQPEEAVLLACKISGTNGPLAAGPQCKVGGVSCSLLGTS